MKTAKEILKDFKKNSFSTTLSDAEIEDCMIIYADQLKQKWISVKDGLPDSDNFYRVLIDGIPTILPYCIYNGKWWCYGESHPTTNSVTHFLPFTV